jgi:hypothetical protein
VEDLFMNSRKILFIIVISSLLLLLQSIALAETRPNAARTYRSDTWKVMFAPYFWTSHLSGEVMAKGQAAEYDMDFGDVLEFQNFAAMIHAEAQRGRLRLMTDVMYIEFSEDIPMSYPEAEVRVNINSDKFYWEFGGGYLLTGLVRERMARSPLQIEVIGGGRYAYLDMELNFQADPASALIQQSLAGARSGKKEWLDPFVGGRAQWFAADKWLLALRADIGGFGLGSELAWNTVARVDYRMSASFALTLGYRVFDVKYEDGEGDDKFVYDTRMMGPLLAMTFRLK